MTSSKKSRTSVVTVLVRHGRLAMKELRETLRDRRTIVTLVLMPVLVYPLLSMAFQRFLIAGVRNQGQAAYLIVVPRQDVADTFQQYLKLSPLRDADGNPVLFEYQVTGDNLADAVVYTSAVLGVDLRVTPENVPIMMLYHREDFVSRYFTRELETRLLSRNVDVLRTRLAENQLSFQLPSEVVSRPVRTATSGSLPLATLVPLILILMTITGAVYPAIDLTAGERERGTLETLIAAPIPRISLLLAKYVAVVTVALLTATVNLVAMTATVQLSGLGPLLFGREGLSITTVIHVFGLLILFAAFFSAILLCITAFARSFKEAQAYLIPLMLVSIAPGLLSMTPEVVLTPGLAAVPLVNMVLVARDVFLGEVDSGLAVVAIITTTLYAIAALAFAARIFGTDAILYGSHRSWSDLFERPSQPAPALAVGAALTCVAVLFPGQFLVGGLLARAQGLPLASRLIAAGAASVLLFIGVPWVSTRLNRVSFAQGFRLRWPHLIYLVAAVILGFSLWPLAVWSLQFGAKIGLAGFTDEQVKALDQFVRQLRAIPLWLVVVTLGIVPGITEELFFRGVLFQSLRKTLSPAATVFVSALLFALFHLVSPGMMTTERFLPSFIMGVLLGWVAHRSGSVLPSMLIHSLHNGLFLGLSPTYQSSDVPSVDALLAVRLPPRVLIATTAGMVIGLALMLIPTKRKTPDRVELTSSLEGSIEDPETQ